LARGHRGGPPGASERLPSLRFAAASKRAQRSATTASRYPTPPHTIAGEVRNEHTITALPVPDCKFRSGQTMAHPHVAVAGEIARYSCLRGASRKRHPTAKPWRSPRYHHHSMMFCWFDGSNV